ncbi:MAG TPA: nitrilase-related carbon-nitrogen hydrolase [Methanospirillum sp.]|nr:nitrilase-related carbon-nitrogen hydrolase [Methanospirillum sp.]
MDSHQYSSMILCTAQIAPCWKDPEATLVKMQKMVADSVECDASFIAFPEQVVTGWDPTDAEFGVEDEGGLIISQLREYARDFSVGILGSYREYHTPRPRNTTVAIGADGQILARYSKIHLFSPGGEDQQYDPGDQIAPFLIDGCRCGLAICYDLRFSDLFRLYRDVGVHLMMVPSAWPALRMRHFDLFTSTRAAEYQMYVAGINTVGQTPVDLYSGGSLVASPDGTAISRACEGEELLFTEIDPVYVDQVRAEFPVYQDRRDVLYGRVRHSKESDLCHF